MADQDEDQNVALLFPPPPPFWKDFTPDNLSRIADLRQEHAEHNGSDTTDPSKVRLEGLPTNLQHLQPPLPPDDGIWHVFGDYYNLDDPLPQLEEMGLPRLYPAEQERDGKHFDRALTMKRIAKSLLLNFLELVGIYSINVNQVEDKITDLRDLFYNFHHIINEYRPHQARESLIALMQSQLDRTRAETNNIRAVKEKVERVLEGLGSLKMDDDSVENIVKEKKDPWLQDSEAWQTLVEECP